MNITTCRCRLLAGIFLCLPLISCQDIATSFFGEAQYKNVHLDPGNIMVPHQRTIDWAKQSAFTDSIIDYWARKPLPDWKSDGKVDAPRVLLAKLLVMRELDQTNETIRNLFPRGTVGSSWVLNKKGDYDFTLTVLTTILYLCGDHADLLYPSTKDHLLNVLLTEDGNSFRTAAPRTLGLVRETENHVLMTEGSRYLKNRWIMLHGNKDLFFDNVHNGMEDKLMSFLRDMKINGLYEFNSLPYIGYTITALLNLEAFSSEKVRNEARDVLDYMNWCYALGSFHLNHYPPMRRRYEKAGIQEFSNNYHSVFMKSWLSFLPGWRKNLDAGIGKEHALMAACMPYRPSDEVVRKQFDKRDGYFVKLGHGPEGCPEIYSAGKHFLLSSGGANRGSRSLIVARPTTLFLVDSVQNLSHTFHLAGPGTDFMKWNNTGVYENFACAAGPVAVPAGYKSISENEQWKIFSCGDSLLIAVHASPDLGILAIFDKQNPQELAEKLLGANPDPENLKSQFQFPGGSKIDFDVNAPKNMWVIKAVDGKPLNRDFDSWPLIAGELNQRNMN